MDRSVTNEVGFSAYAFSKPRISLAANRVGWTTKMIMKIPNLLLLK